MKFNRLFFGLMMFAAIAEHQMNIVQENRMNPCSKFGTGGGGYEKCPKHFTNKRKRNKIRNRMARKSRQINRKVK